ncbi:MULTISPECIES: enoyl-CoA hydratase-related protein [unclassified Rhizobium]|uniref:enoyl-CoA hydratase-related protein n=1 Tax=unclassified Rhizobium TaxID=2613769 RepID=UPI001784F074|nr:MULTISPECIES: enoyl-CoA hydratase-related protein [unclassified Rhizobium]MBD8687654.1 enoyl-CoA hydratase/isomerase family protein [Rhizobium sp. CFBP 13644]MBD8692108.1 enoyl-CoA hydratase/isomerase family protein [Rhizobium sp. CFBP 13717]
MIKVRLEREGDIGVIVIDNPPVNAGSAAVRQGLLNCIASVDADPSLIAGVLIGSGNTFISGSDLKEFDLPLDPPQLPHVIEAIEHSAKPWIAALHGAALGGGFELALGCDMRVAHPGTMVGLPECGLGMIPGAGGIQRLTRLIGRIRAIELITSSRRIEASEAAALGMIDEIVTGDLRLAAITAAKALNNKRRLVEKPVLPEHEADIFAAEELAVATGRRRPHILSAIRHIEAVGNLPFNEGLMAEREDFQKFRTSPDARAYRHVFFAERAAGRVHTEFKAKMPSRLGIVGACEAACAIALAGILAGRHVTIFDTDRKSLKASIDVGLREKVNEGSLSVANAQAARDRLSVESDIGGLSKCESVITAIDESSVAGTSVLSRTGSRLFSLTLAPESSVDLHFINPWDRDSAVEVIKTETSSASSLAQGVAFARACGYKAVIAGNAPGFIGQRVHAAYRNACDTMAAEGVSALKINEALIAFGFADGPLTVNGERFAEVDLEISEAKLTVRDIQRAALAAMVREAERVMEEGIAETPGDVDVVMVNGFGFPRWLGGPLYWATSDAGQDILRPCVLKSA